MPVTSTTIRLPLDDHRHLTRVPASPPAKLKSSRLLLRRPQLDDAASIHNLYAGDAQVTRFLNWKEHRDVDETGRFVQQCIDAWTSGEGYAWMATRWADERLVGMIECRIDAHGANIGYVVARPHWNQGYGTEIVECIVKWALSTKFVHRVWAYCDVENVASARVLEKAGFRREGLLRKWIILPNLGDVPRDCNCFSIVK